MANSLYRHEHRGLRAQSLLEEKHYSFGEAIKDSRLKGACVESRRVICFKEMTISISQLHLYLQLYKYSGIGGEEKLAAGRLFPKLLF